MGKNLYVSALLDVYGNFLGEKQKALAEYYYNEDYSLSEIAENEGITRQGVRDAVKRAEIQLLTLEESCHYCEKFLKLKSLTEQARKGELEDYSGILDLIEEL